MEETKKKSLCTTQLVFIKGDVYDARSFGADGLVVFYSGLSDIRVTAVKHKKDKQFNAAFRFTRYIDTDHDGANDEIGVKNIDDMHKLLNHVLDEALANKCRIIVMNGIRVTDRPDIHTRPEMYQIQFIIEWMDLHPGVFDKICLIDRRDGFNNANNKI